MQASEGELKNLEPTVNSKMGGFIETCFSKNTSNAEKFGDCVVEKNKKL